MDSHRILARRLLLDPCVLCRAGLDKFCIGDVRVEPGESVAVQYQQPAEQQQFYTILRQRVEKYFRKNEVR